MVKSRILYCRSKEVICGSTKLNEGHYTTPPAQGGKLLINTKIFTFLCEIHDIEKKSLYLITKEKIVAVHVLLNGSGCSQTVQVGWSRGFTCGFTPALSGQAPSAREGRRAGYTGESPGRVNKLWKLCGMKWRLAPRCRPGFCCVKHEGGGCSPAETGRAPYSIAGQVPHTPPTESKHKDSPISDICLYGGCVKLEKSIVEAHSKEETLSQCYFNVIYCCFNVIHCWPSVALTLSRRRRRRANIKATLGQCLVFAGSSWLVNLPSSPYSPILTIQKRIVQMGIGDFETICSWRTRRRHKQWP